MTDEQDQELEVLKAIFMDALVEEGTSPRKFYLSLWPTAGADDSHVGLKFQVTYPKNYPAEAPIIQLDSLKGLLPAQLTELSKKIAESAAENVGSQVVFSLTTIAKEWLDDLDTHYIQKKEEIKKKQEREIEEREQKRLAEEAAKRVGTVVNRETFTAWNAKFLAELQASNPTRATSSRSTGRQLFEQDASMIMSDDVFIKKMEASLGSSMPEEEPAVAAQPSTPLTFVPLPQASDPLLADPSNQYLFDNMDDDEVLPESDEESPAPAPAPSAKKPEKDEKPKPAQSKVPEPKAAAKQESKPAAKPSAPSPAAQTTAPKASSPKPSGKAKTSKK